MASKAVFLLLAHLLFFTATRTVACGGGCPPPPKPPKPCPPGPGPNPSGKCPIDTIKLGGCANVLNGLINVTLGKPPKTPCCSLIEGLADLEAAVCLCTVLKETSSALASTCPSTSASSSTIALLISIPMTDEVIDKYDDEKP
ncbi:hypothetical protein HPP92_021999 [Vanilla planifolia]|uniref:Hydrophobic seed protein domain-containing protein n=1 Tax=Vanilla planifolia TaxID=51239 RepID=A0A835PRE7_VANPL|nr:hypothetical protein HPP92_021999 [Vanilla planifolia]